MGQSKVADLGFIVLVLPLTLAEEDILQLDIVMDDSGAVDVLQAL